jgi:hypothetical protein
MEAEHTFWPARSSVLPRLVSEDGGQTWRIAELDDEDRDDLVWDALFAPEGSAHWPKALWDPADGNRRRQLARCNSTSLVD